MYSDDIDPRALQQLHMQDSWGVKSVTGTCPCVSVGGLNQNSYICKKYY